MLLDQIAAAFDRQDYKLAAELLKTFLHQSPQDPWGQVYRAKLYEVSGRIEDAKAIYQNILRTVTSSKIISMTRSQLQQLQDREQSERRAAIAQAKSAPENAEPGVLILEAIALESRQKAAQAMSQIFNLDAYTARLQIPNTGWKLYRAGAIGELQLYGQQLRAEKIPCFWTKENQLNSLPVFEIKYFLDYEPQASVVCHNQQGQLGSLTFDWSEVSQRVEGMLPILENVVDSSMRQGIQRQRKEQTQDYVRICDLHLPKRRCILRICDWKYSFDQGLEFVSMGNNTIDLDDKINRLHWNSLLTFLNAQIKSKPVWSDFTVFAESAIDSPFLLKRIPAKISAYGQNSELWDSAFQLYSCLAFLRDSI